MKTTRRIVIVDDHGLFRAGVKSELGETIDVVGEEVIAVFVRDRGSGFDPAEVSPDSHGIAESIRGRMARAGGTASIVSAPGEGTEVELVLPRRRT